MYVQCICVVLYTIYDVCPMYIWYLKQRNVHTYGHKRWVYMALAKLCTQIANFVSALVIRRSEKLPFALLLVIRRFEKSSVASLLVIRRSEKLPNALLLVIRRFEKSSVALLLVIKRLLHCWWSGGLTSCFIAGDQEVWKVTRPEAMQDARYTLYCSMGGCGLCFVE